MTRLLLLFTLILGVVQLNAQEYKEMLLYPDGAPDSNGLSGDAIIAADTSSLHNVTTPKMFLFLPDKSKATGQVVIVCPGGGYGGLAAGHEGKLVAKWLTSNGIAAVVLWYRMPNGNYEIPLRDVHRAIEITRSNSDKWGINPDRLGVMGFSAGGHLASTAATQFTQSTRPDFSILIYPVISTTKQTSHFGSRDNLMGKNPSKDIIERFSNELQVKEQTPPTFIALSDDDDGVPPVNSTDYYNALKKAGVAAELHIYPTGNHGWGFNENWPYKDELRTSLLRWLGQQNK